MPWLDHHARAGFTPFQDHRDKVSTGEALSYRAVQYGARIVDREKFGGWLLGEETIGDLNSAFLFKAGSGRRAVSGWSYAWPSIVDASSGGAVTTGGGSTASGVVNFNTATANDFRSGGTLFNVSSPGDFSTAGRPTTSVVRGSSSLRTRGSYPMRILPVIGKKGGAITSEDPALSGASTPTRLAPDGRFETETFQLSGPWPKFPPGTLGLVNSATNEDSQVGVFLPTDPRLIANHHGGEPANASLVCDMKNPAAIDATRTARLHGFFRVIAGPTAGGSSIQFRNENLLAQQFAPTDLDGIGGYGSFYDEADSGRGAVTTPSGGGYSAPGGAAPGPSGSSVPSSGLPPGTYVSANGTIQPIPKVPSGGGGNVGGFGDPGPNSTLFGSVSGANSVPFVTTLSSIAPLLSKDLGVFKPGGGRAVGLMSWHGASGPLTPGHASTDIHAHGTDADGNSINSGHLSTFALFRVPGAPTGAFDGPLEFETANYDGAAYPLRSAAMIRWHPGLYHLWMGQMKPGRWVLEAEVPMGGEPSPPTKKPTTTPSDPPRKPQPPVTPHDPPRNPTSPPVTTPSNPAPAQGIALNSGEAPAQGTTLPILSKPDNPSPFSSYVPYRAVPTVVEYAPFGSPGVKARKNGGPPEKSPLPFLRPGYVRAPTKTGVREDIDDPEDDLFTFQSIGFPTWVVRPPSLNSAHPNLRYAPGVPEHQFNAIRYRTPTVARFEGFGKQTPSGEWSYAQKPNTGRYRGGTASGGLAFMPPEFSIDDFANDFSRSNTTPSDTYFVAVPGAYWAAGYPLPSSGTMKTGYRWGTDSSGVLAFKSVNSSGTVASTASFGANASGLFQVKESGGTLLTMGAVNDGEFLKRSGTSIVSGASAGGSAFPSGFVFITSADSPYTAGVGDIGKMIVVDSTGGAILITLPNAPSDGTLIGVTLDAGVNGVTVQRAGADVFVGPADYAFNRFVLSQIGMSAVESYDATSGAWRPVGYAPPADTDGAYPALRMLGTGSTDACAGDDSRLGDNRTPIDGTVTKSKLANQDVVDVKQSVAIGVTSTIDADYCRVVVGPYSVVGTLVTNGVLRVL